MSFVDQILDLEPAEPHSFAQFQNVGDGLSGRFSRGTKQISTSWGWSGRERVFRHERGATNAPLRINY